MIFYPNILKLGVVFLYTILYSTAICQWEKVTPTTGFDSYTTYCVKDEYLFISNLHNAIYRSSDNGDTWVTINNVLPDSRQVYAMSSSGGYLVLSSFTPMLGEQPGIYRSTNYGDTWSIAEGNGSSVDGATSFCHIGKYLLASVPGMGIIRSLDDGNSWVNTSQGISGYPINVVSDGIYVYANTYRDKLYRSADSGATWTMIQQDGILGIVFGVGADTIHNSHVYASSSDIYRSNDHGESWIKLDSAYTIYGTEHFAFHNEYVFAGGIGVDRPVYYSRDNGNTWVDFGGQLGNDKVYLLFIKDTYLFLGTHEGLWRRPLSDLSVASEINLLSLTIFPSPAQDHISIELPDGVHAKSLSIIDILGRTVYFSDVVSAEAIQISHLQSGYYKVICTSDKGTVSGSFTK